MPNAGNGELQDRENNRKNNQHRPNFPSMLNSILSRPGEAAAIPKSCRFDESDNKGRIHGDFNLQQPALSDHHHDRHLSS